MSSLTPQEAGIIAMGGDLLTPMVHHGFTLAFPHDYEYRVSAHRPAHGDTIRARGALWTVTEVHGKRYVLRQVIYVSV